VAVSPPPAARFQAAVAPGLADQFCAGRTDQLLGVVRNLRRYRTVADTPTSRIASAPQGYIELVGPAASNRRGPAWSARSTACPACGTRLPHRAPSPATAGNTSNPECRTIHSASHDGSGLLLVDPDGAEISLTQAGHHAGGYRKKEWTFNRGRTLYVIGEHVTLGWSQRVLDKKSDLKPRC